MAFFALLPNPKLQAHGAVYFGVSRHQDSPWLGLAGLRRGLRGFFLPFAQRVFTIAAIFSDTRGQSCSLPHHRHLTIFPAIETKRYHTYVGIDKRCAHLIRTYAEVKSHE